MYNLASWQLDFQNSARRYPDRSPPRAALAGRAPQHAAPTRAAVMPSAPRPATHPHPAARKAARGARVLRYLVTALAVVLSNRSATAAFTQWLRFDGAAVAPTATVALLQGSGFGPGSVFAPSSAAVAVSADGWAAVELPPFSVATVTAECLSC